ncbi:unnamed protein product, partial [Mesorhabditis belari]|uniref:Protein kinase domain-containing protein n=1 Tax=Mesorhabditis belari TaxID=2138241 RepID=A0AAF3FC15_9BILA
MVNIYAEDEFYSVIEDFRSGGFGRVSINRFKNDNREVAIKWPKDPKDRMAQVFIKDEIRYHQIVSDSRYVVTFFGSVRDKKRGILLDLCYLETLHHDYFLFRSLKHFLKGEKFDDH